MKHRLFFPVGVVLFAIASLAAVPALAQTTSNGPYYATPAWDQKLDCTTMATCPRFIVLLNWSSAAVLDRETGLVWERSPSTSTFPSASTNLVATAAFHCNDLNLGNRTGWRLPTIQELMSLVDRSVPFPPTLPPGHPFIGVQSSAYWSATTSASNTSHAWVVGFAFGNMGTFDKSTNGVFVWCVRGGQGVDPQ